MVTVTQQIVMLWDEGYSMADIRRLTGKPRTTVWTVLLRHRPGFKHENTMRAARAVIAAHKEETQ